MTTYSFTQGVAPFMLSEVQDAPNQVPAVRNTRRVQDAPRAREVPVIRQVPASRIPARQESNPAPTRTCAVCLEDDVEFATTTPSHLCTHPPTVCVDCLYEYIHAAIIDRSRIGIACPTVDCGLALTYQEVVAAARDDRVLVERFDSLLLRRALRADETFVWCKNPNCGSGQCHDGGNSAPIITCRTCRTKSCFEHDVIWHEGLTCSEYDAIRRPTNVSTAAYLQRFTKVCPGCTRMVEKIDGCDHMVCAAPGGCGHEFCWACLADYKDIRQYGNASHKQGCPHRA